MASAPPAAACKRCSNNSFPNATGNQKKLLKMLNRIRKRAGKVRDLDVQLAALAQPERFLRNRAAKRNSCRA